MTFLVFNTDPIVLLDMIAILRNALPSAVIEQAMTLTDARKAIERASDLTGAFVDMSVADFDRTNLSELIAHKNGKVVMSYFGQDGLEQTIVQRGWTPLEMPFTNETVQTAILNAGFASR